MRLDIRFNPARIINMTTEPIKPVSYINKVFPRKSLQDVEKYMETKEILGLVGPRQVGKTTSLKYLQEKVTSQGKKSAFITFESLQDRELFETNIELFSKLHVIPNDVIFIDEVQYAKEAGQKLKYLYDTLGKKFVVSGSSSLDVRDMGKFLVGRINYFKFYPLSFYEYLESVDPSCYQYLKDAVNNQISTGAYSIKLNDYFDTYLVYGGYPRVLESPNDEDKQKVLKDLLDNYVVKDIKGLLGLTTSVELINLAKALSLQLGGLVEYKSLGDLSGFSPQAVKNHLKILEETFVICGLYPYFTNKESELSKNPKMYFWDSGFRNAVIKNFQEASLRMDKSLLLENYVYNQLRHDFEDNAYINFWRTGSGAEVDFVVENQGKLVPIEVKSSNVKNREIGKSFFSFIEKYKPSEGYIVTGGGDFGFREENGCRIHFIPAYFFSL